MKFILLTKDPSLVSAAKEGFHPSDTFASYEAWDEALDACENVDLLFLDMVATLKTPHKIAGYEEFAMAKMAHPIAKDIPLVLISPPEDYELDFMAGWPDFVFAHLKRPVSAKIFRRASTWV
jgi:hypothetical protein